ncbi:MAG: peptidoglycan DD-metalloendopeptidase family protein [Candidatus Parcubacteria bacterium]|nr:peptidoglycan DD-metalloendopeptidase family protein [Candidatus Parcubacteria bacterium]
MRTLTKIFSPILAFSILSGMLFVLLFIPLRANASFLSSVLGGDALAQTDKIESTDNSQTMDLLQANVSSASIFQDKSDKKDSKEDDKIDVSIDVKIVDKNALSSTTGPWGDLDGTDAIDSSCGETDIYVVADGNTIPQVAKLLGVTEDTVLAANGMKKKLIKNDVLFIPSVSGVKHTVTKGQTLQKIAKLYKVDINDIAFCNSIAPDAKIAVNDEFVIPGGRRVEESVKPTKNTTTTKDIYYFAKNLAGFINPVPGYRLSQGLHDGNAVDLAIAKGTPIHATASGRIIFAKMGYNGGFGGLVIIDHPASGTQTMYGHMSKIIVHAGDPVTQHDIIGNVGSTGRSTGPHVHFVVKGGFNPGVNRSWAN